MYRPLTTFCLAVVLFMAAARESMAFSLGGPVAGESYQTTTIGYGVDGDVLSPRMLNQQYRFNTPILYYTCDQTFLDFFGSDGINAMDSALAVFNALTNVSSYSSNLAEFPLNSTRYNFTAQALGLVDLKSTIMSHMLEELGLAPADKWTWCLRSRTGNPCPTGLSYGVIERNIDPNILNYSTYVNGAQYGFIIVETCGPAVPFADAVEYPVDPTENTYTPVASQTLSYLRGTGIFFGGFTRDDMGGLRYMLSSKRVASESPSTNSLAIESTAPGTIVTSNYLQLLSLAAVETPSQLLSNYPTLNITSSNVVGESNIITTNFQTVVTTNPGSPFGQGTGGTVVTNLVPVLTTNFQPIYAYTFGNLTFPLVYFNNGVLITNFNEFIFAPTNTCGFTLLSNLGTVLVTNTNTAPVSFFTNHTLAIELPNCVTNAEALYQGVERLTFFRKDFDSLLSQFWSPITNTYTLTFVTNGTTQTRTFSRRITTPDFLFQASDQGDGFSLTRTVPTFVKSFTAPAADGGPGIIEPPNGTSVSISFTTAGPIFDLSASSFLNDFNAIEEPLWGTFDGSTNTPIVYPDSLSLANLENLLYLQFTVAGPLPNGRVSSTYSFQLTAQGQSPPFSWVIDPSQGSLPPGLSLTSNGLITGTPTAPGIYDFAVILSDSSPQPNQRVVERNFSIEID
jgi:hypothetical protein